MVKPLTFKGDKKAKKRQRTTTDQNDDDVPERQKKQFKASATSSDITSTAAAASNEEIEGEEHDDSWVSADTPSDVSGPIMFVLPTEPPTALACDVTGKVFTLPIENIVDGNPATAEPHDVRQVWVAYKIVGTENHRFKGYHGKYVMIKVSSEKAPSSFPIPTKTHPIRITINRFSL